jgi:hypothetical protein
VIRLEAHAKQYYARKSGDVLGGGEVGALPGLLIAGPVGAAIGAVVGATVGNALKNGDPSEQDVARFLLRYYRKSSSGIKYIELTHREEQIDFGIAFPVITAGDTMTFLRAAPASILTTKSDNITPKNTARLLYADKCLNVISARAAPNWAAAENRTARP